MSDPASQKSFFQDLWERRFFQFFATYVGVGWGLIQFVEWLVKRYSLPSIYVDKLAVFLLLLLPFVLSYIYIHGRKGHDEWFKFEKVFYPINIVVAMVCSLFLISSSATTETIEIETLEGDIVSREIPKAEFTKRIALFPMECDFKESENWRELAVTLLLEKDLEQDMRMITISPVSLNSEFEDYGARPLEVVPFATAIKIAKDRYCDAFLTGKLSKKQNLYTVNATLYSTKKGNVITEANFSSESIYGLADQLSSHIQKDLSGYHVETENKLIDLPAIDLITDNEKALRHYVEGMRALTNNINDIPTILKHLKESVAEDEKCAECLSFLAQVESLGGQSGMETMKLSMQHIESLPERQQLRIKYSNYFTQQEPDKAIKLLEIWRKLYPQDSNPYDELVKYYNLTRQFDKAKGVALEALKNGHKAGMYLTLANLYLITNDFNEAEKYVSLYEKEYPERASKKPVIAKVYSGKGDFDKALEFYEKQNVLDPNDLNVYKNIVEIQIKQNKFIEANKTLQDGFSRASGFKDTLGLITTEMSIYDRKGQVKKYYEKEAELKSVFNRHLPPAVYIQTFYSHIQNYGRVNDTLTLRKRLDEVKNAIPQQEQLFTVLNNYLYHMTTENLDSMRVAYENAKEILFRTNGPQIEPLALGMIAFFEKNYQKALDYFDEYVKITGTVDYLLDYYKSICYRRLQEYDKGHEVISVLLVSDPLNPLFNLEKAQLYLAEKKFQKAKDHLAVSLEVWKDADPKYKYAIEAKELAKELKM